MSERDPVRLAFAQQAAAFEDATRHFRSDAVLTWLLANTQTKPGDVVLEVAAGTGIFARAIAGSVAAVVAIDVTPEMLAEGKRAADNEGHRNLIFQEGDATHLPFLNESFDRVLCRLAIHHFLDPLVPLREMVRVCRGGGSIVVVDMVAPDDDSQARFDDLERRRDPSHARALTSQQLQTYLELAGCRIVSSATRDNHLNGERWLQQTATSPADADYIRDAWRNELGGGPATGMRPTAAHDGIELVHRWYLYVAEKV